MIPSRQRRLLIGRRGGSEALAEGCQDHHAARCVDEADHLRGLHHADHAIEGGLGLGGELEQVGAPGPRGEVVEQRDDVAALGARKRLDGVVLHGAGHRAHHDVGQLGRGDDVVELVDEGAAARASACRGGAAGGSRRSVRMRPGLAERTTMRSAM